MEKKISLFWKKESFIYCLERDEQKEREKKGGERPSRLREMRGG